MGMRGRVGTPTALALYSTLSFSVSRALFSDFSLSFVFVCPFLLYILFCLSLRQFYPLHFCIQSYFSLSFPLLHISSRSNFCNAPRFSTDSFFISFSPSTLSLFLPVYLSLSFHFACLICLSSIFIFFFFLYIRIFELCCSSRSLSVLLVHFLILFPLFLFSSPISLLSICLGAHSSSSLLRSYFCFLFLFIFFVLAFPFFLSDALCVESMQERETIMGRTGWLCPPQDIGCQGEIGNRVYPPSVLLSLPLSIIFS